MSARDPPNLKLKLFLSRIDLMTQAEAITTDACLYMYLENSATPNPRAEFQSLQKFLKITLRNLC